MAKKVAILGAGANGASIGVDLTKAGHDVVLIDQWPEHVQAMRERGARIEMPEETLVQKVRAYNLCDVCTFTQPFDISMNSHMCGTVVAGADAGASVLDGHCKAHDLDNLWVVDAGFFPSSAAMNPALTIAAQALRVVGESELAG